MELADGLTVFVGPNNCGKSAVVAALQILCNNDNSTYVTRHNERECSIAIDTDDGHSVQWSRKNNSPRYMIDGQPFDRLERGGVPDILHDVLRLRKVVAEGNREFDVHFGEQKSPVFLVDKPGSYAAQFFASSSDAASLVEMQKRHQQRTADARRERIRLETQAEKLASGLSILAVTSQFEIDVRQLESQDKELEHLASAIDELKRHTIVLKKSTESFERHEAETAVLGILTFPPILLDPKPLIGILANSAATENELSRQSALAAELLTLEVCPDLPDERSLADLIEDLLTAQENSNRLRGESSAMNRLVPPPALVAFEPLQTMLLQIKSVGQEVAVWGQTLKALQPLQSAPQFDDEVTLSEDISALTNSLKFLGRVEATHRCLDILGTTPELTDAREIQKMIGDLAGAATAFNLQNQAFADAEELLEEGKHQLRAWAERQQVCPTCGQVLDPALIILHAESHNVVRHRHHD